jgi:hypothetical protein
VLKTQNNSEILKVWRSSLACCLLAACSAVAAEASINGKIVLVWDGDDSGGIYSSTWARANLLEPLLDDPRIKRLAYSVPFCDAEQIQQCEADAGIKFVIEMYGAETALAEITGKLVSNHSQLPLAVYRVKERQPRAYARNWSLGEATPGVRMVALMTKKSDSTADQFDAYWRDQHTPIALAQPVAVWNYLQNTVIDCEGKCATIDGIALEQFQSATATRDRWLKTPWSAFKGVWSAMKFMDLSQARMQLMTEFVVKDDQ